MQGTVKFFNTQKGFGFIEVAGNHKDIFVHKTGLNKGVEITEGDNVTFTVAEGQKGQVATNVSVVK